MPDQSSAASEHALIQEISAPLEGLPDDPLAYVDADFPVAMRGYDRHAVDEYVERTRRLVAELQATRSPESAVRRALERVGSEVSGILQRAHETAEQITAQSRVEAEDRLEQARQEAAQIIAAAERRVRELDADTDRIWAERQRIVSDAEDLSSQLLALARDAGQRFDEDEVSEDEDEDVGHAGEEPAGASTGPMLDHAAGLVDEPSGAEPEAGPEPEGVEGRAAEDDDHDPGVDETIAFSPLRHPEERPVPLAGLGDEAASGEKAASGEEAASDAADDRGDGPQDPPEYTPGGDARQAADPAAGAGDEPRPRRAGDEESTRIIPPASDAAHRRRQS